MYLSWGKDTCSLYPCEGLWQERLPEAAMWPNRFHVVGPGIRRGHRLCQVEDLQQPQKSAAQNKAFLFFHLPYSKGRNYTCSFSSSFFISSPSGSNYQVREQVWKMSREKGGQPISPFRHPALFLINIWISKLFLANTIVWQNCLWEVYIVRCHLKVHVKTSKWNTCKWIILVLTKKKSPWQNKVYFSNLRCFNIIVL